MLFFLLLLWKTRNTDEEKDFLNVNTFKSHAN